MAIHGLKMTMQVVENIKQDGNVSSRRYTYGSKSANFTKYDQYVFSIKNTKTMKHPNEAFGARKTQKFGYSVLRQIRALFWNLRLLLSKTQYILDITSKVRIVLKEIFVNIYRENLISDEK